MSIYKGHTLTLTIFGTSHGSSIGMMLNGFPAGQKIDYPSLAEFMARRAPGNSPLSTSRKEPDRPEFISGIVSSNTNGLEKLVTDGTEIKAIIYNKDIKSSDYSKLSNTPRPGHADYTAHVKYGGTEDPRGGGAFSGRMTAPLCIAGGICKQLLEERGIYINASIYDIHGNKFEPLSEIKKAQVLRDSVGGTISCTISGLAAGYGGPLFEGIEGRIAEAIYAIPAVKGIEFGAGFESTLMYGSDNNDEFYYDECGIVRTRTNNCGGILGGISNGMDIVFRTAIKPTPSIARPQSTILYDKCEETEIEIQGRHDPCIVPRAIPCVEAAAAVVIADMVLTEEISKNRSDITDLSSLRSSIDKIDMQLLGLIEQRLRIAESVAAYKQENDLEIVDNDREAALLKRIRSLSNKELVDLNEEIYKAIISASCKHQEAIMK
ncbi:chorismate synthase [Mogibacterium pumilum]|uniref:Chorismate synthase n=1 Tax=Mogibacterium pumilum TaxID=86332 RepID=A0A223ATL2_9FIRM|nr:chorismate synthase [Mogibacterium pumilum]ASS38304.1 chorismate synthase [Mogibacterium pumilum]